MGNNNNITNSLAPSPVSLTGSLLMLILLNLVIILKQLCSTFRTVVAQFIDNETHNLQTAKPEAPMETRSAELSLDELKLVMEKLGTLYDPDAGELQDRTGSLEITEQFVEQEPSLQEDEEAFCIFDQNNDGFIDAAELKKVISTLSSTVPSESECASMIRTYDSNGEGVIDFNEFLQLLTCSFS